MQQAQNPICCKSSVRSPLLQRISTAEFIFLYLPSAKESLPTRPGPSSCGEPAELCTRAHLSRQGGGCRWRPLPNLHFTQPCQDPSFLSSSAARSQIPWLPGAIPGHVFAPFSRHASVSWSREGVPLAGLGSPHLLALGAPALAKHMAELHLGGKREQRTVLPVDFRDPSKPLHLIGLGKQM